MYCTVYIQNEYVYSTVDTRRKESQLYASDHQAVVLVLFETEMQTLASRPTTGELNHYKCSRPTRRDAGRMIQLRLHSNPLVQQYGRSARSIE